MTNNPVPTGITAGLALFAFSGATAATISTDSVAPIADVAQYQVGNTIGGMSVRVNDSNPDRTLGQSFSSTIDGSFNAITVLSRGGNDFSGLSSGEGDMILAVWDTDSNSSLGNFTVDFAGMSFSNGDFVTFELESTIAVSSGGNYAFEMAWDPSYIAGDSILRNFAINRDTNTGTYAVGSQISRTNYTEIPVLTTNGGSNSHDLEFYVHTVVPETGMYGLLVGCVVLTGVAFRRRR